MRQRGALVLLLIGLLLAGLATVLVIGIARQAAEAGRGEIRQVAVVTATRDIPDQTLITAEALTVKPFPASFVPDGALAGPEQVVGKFANGFIARDQVVVAGQVAPSRRSANLSDRVPSGRVVVWLPMPELLASANVLRPGDHVDILLSVSLGGGDANQPGGLSTQTTLQNVEVFAIGQQEAGRAAPSTPTPDGQPASGGQGEAGARRDAAPTGRAVGFLVDHQDAVTIKFVKDSGGMIDLVVRSAEELQIVRTEALTLDALAERFRFRVPGPVVR